ncbi:MAG: aldehyde ferredoxin oxidoreductase family protein [Candidatus Lokiarchaeota archaeon]|nr:aldehyde ferredoxin oxidoreductase family protein [Candidatus Harpocratesius repetitus]
MVEGYTQTCVRINLTTGEIKKETLSQDFCKQYIGGYGFVTKILWDECPKGADAFDPRNPFVMAIGPFPGTIVPTSSKYCVGAKSPLTRRIGFAISSGSCGAQMRRAGIDLIILTGKAPEPVFIFFDDDAINIIPCKDTLWGKDIWTVEEEIRNMYGDHRISVMGIGQAGENLAKLACITNDRARQAGRTGLGAVMGSKNVKAMAFRGTKSIKVAKPKEFMEKAKELIQLANGKDTLKYRDLGTPINVMKFNDLGVLPVKNFQTGYWDKADAISGETMDEKWVVKKTGCSQCPIACDHLCATKPDDPDYPNVVSSVDYESIYALGSVCLIDHFPAIIKMVEMCDKYGIDTMTGGTTLGFAIEAYEKGYITKEMLGDNPVYKNGLQWGDYKAVVQLIEDICFRSTPAGDLLADGSRDAAKKLGGDAWKFSCEIKGMGIPGYELKGLTTASIGFAVSLRGACHLRNGSYGYDMKKKFDRKKYDELDKRGQALAGQDAFMAIIDSLVVCKFTRGIYHRGLPEIAEVYEMVTGIPMTGEEIELAGHRIHDLAKCFNIRECQVEGVEPMSEDSLPWRNFHEPNLDGPTKGWYNDEKGFWEGIKQYYLARGWDERGYPKEETLKTRGLDFVIGKI